MSDPRSGGGDAQASELRRPNPLELDPHRSGLIRGYIGGYTRVFNDTWGSNQPPVDRGPWRVERREVYRIPPAGPETRRSRLAQWWFARRWNIKESDYDRRISDYAARRHGALWGLACGWCAGGGDGAQTFETLLAAVRAALRSQVDFRAYADLLRGDGTSSASLLAPAWSPRSLARGAFAPAHYFAGHINQLLNEVPWDALSVTFPIDPAGRRLETLSEAVAKAAPAFDGALACYAFRCLLSDCVVGGVSPEKGWGSLIGEEGAYDAYWPIPATRLLNFTTARDAPLARPETPRDVLHAALWANLEATSYRDVIDAVTSLGGDTVACAAAAGVLAGSRFGAEGISARDRACIPDTEAVELVVSAMLARDAPYTLENRRFVRFVRGLTVPAYEW